MLPVVVNVLFKEIETDLTNFYVFFHVIGVMVVGMIPVPVPVVMAAAALLL